jgi:calmodulin
MGFVSNKEEEANKCLKEMDLDGDGSVDLSQFMVLWTSFKAKVGDDGDTEDDIKMAFREYDIDNDGYITKDEMIEVITNV